MKICNYLFFLNQLKRLRVDKNDQKRKERFKTLIYGYGRSQIEKNVGETMKDRKGMVDKKGNETKSKYILQDAFT